MAEDGKSYHQFFISNNNGVIIRCCVHCGLSHQMEGGQAANSQIVYKWKLILEKEGDKTFAEPCPVESGSDTPFPYHHFMLSHHSSVLRFCIHCGLSHLLVRGTELTLRLHDSPSRYYFHTPVWYWELIHEDERDLTVSDLSPLEQDSETLKRRYLPVPKN